MFDIAAFDAEITRKNRLDQAADDVRLSEAFREPSTEAGVKQLGVTSAMMFAVVFGAIQSGPSFFCGAQQPSASLDPSALETYAMHLDAPQSDHDLISLFDSLNRS